MKTIKIIAPLAAVFTFLFFDEGEGINYLLFYLIYLPVLFKLHPQSFVRKETLSYALATLMAAVCVLLYGNFLSVLAFWIAFTFLNVQIQLELSSVLTLLLYSLYAFSATFLIRLKNAMWAASDSEKQQETEKPRGLNPWFIWLISISILALFMTFYRHASPGFNQFILNLNLDFLTVPMFFFFLFSFGLLYIWVRPALNHFLSRNEAIWKDNTRQYEFRTYTFLGAEISKETENKLAMIVFSGLNFMLLLMNIFDTGFLFTHELPEGVNYSEYVHQGVGAIIMSIICAIIIILWFYRGNRTYTEHKITGYLVMFWIALNFWMIADAALRNHMYIMDYFLFTYKRIGVYYFLGLSVMGLCFTAYKLIKGKNNYYLVRTNTTVWFWVLILSCFVNWDRSIAEYHTSKCVAAGKTPDLEYLLRLSEEAYPAACKELLKLKPYEETNTNRQGETYTELELPNYLNHVVNYSIHNMYNEEIGNTWKSYCLSSPDTYKEIYSIMQQAPEPYISAESKQQLKELAE